MTKYTRSINKVSSCIQDIFKAGDLSLDTKAILLVLAATMSSSKLKRFLAPLSVLSPIYAPLMEINSIRIAYGAAFRDYIILSALKAAKQDIKSDELQRIISDARSATIDPAVDIQPALSQPKLIDLGNDKQLNAPEFALTKQSIIDFLLDNLAADHRSELNTLIDAYLQTRTTETPQTAYTALVSAMAEILTTSGFDWEYSKLYSNKIAQHVLKDFIHQPQDQPEILHAYNTNDLRSGW